jgi:methylated-DNA-[protein]-cysteine S-methyltransferase
MKKAAGTFPAGAPAHRYLLLPSDLGFAALVWEAGGAERAVRIYLPVPRRELQWRIRRDFPGAVLHETGPAGKAAAALENLLRGEAASVPPEALETTPLAPFRRAVLLETGRIPRGRVRSYRSLAAAAGHPGAVRAVGTVMAGNPFPLAIPCHRVVRSDGNLGGFGGGAAMKRALLLREGIGFDGRGRVLPGFLI